MQNPELLREELTARKDINFAVIDEIQKVPALLDEIHWLHENTAVRFALCGSSARKVKRGHANLLGGRAVRYELAGLVWPELKDAWNLEKLLNHGYQPRIFLTKYPSRLLASYVGDYLKEEIAQEGLVQNLPSFADFLNMAAISDTNIVNFSNIARDCGISSTTVKKYFQILEDTLIASWLPAYKKRGRGRREITASKFYLFDVGIVNFLSRRKNITPGTSGFGEAFENYCLHEIKTYNAYFNRFEPLFYWRLASGIEVDFIIGDMHIGIEVKSSNKISDRHLKGLRELIKEYPDIERRIVISLEKTARKTADGIEILPITGFLNLLWNRELF